MLPSKQCAILRLDGMSLPVENLFQAKNDKRVCNTQNCSKMHVFMVSPLKYANIPEVTSHLSQSWTEFMTTLVPMVLYSDAHK